MTLDKKAFLDTIMEDVDNDLGDEEVTRLLIQQKLSEDVHKSVEAQYTFGQNAADVLAKFAGSWKFVGIFGLILTCWMVYNIVTGKPFDPYPFILLNLVLSCMAAIQAPLIMMSQNRQEEKDRQRAENDYKVNLKAEFIVQNLHEKMDTILDNQAKINEWIEQVSQKNN